MTTRTEILQALTDEHEEFLAYYQGLTPEELECPCTESEVPGADAWTAKDHLAHLVVVERAFQGIIRRALRGDVDPVGFSRVGAKNREEVLAWIGRNNQKHRDVHHEDSIETILADLAMARRDTLGLLEQLTDEQLAISLPGAVWADGTIGGILITNAQHERMHQRWVDEGLKRMMR